MKLLLLFVVSCLAVQNGTGAPATARYMMVRCNPGDGAANCGTVQSPEMPWSPDLATKLPASAAQHLAMEPVEDEHPDTEDWTQMQNSPFVDGSGYNEGSAAGEYVEDHPFVTREVETGSGERNVELVIGEDMVKEEEMQKDQLIRN